MRTPCYFAFRTTIRSLLPVFQGYHSPGRKPLITQRQQSRGCKSAGPRRQARNPARAAPASHTTDRTGVSRVWLPQNHGRTEATRLRGEPQTSSPPAARRQFTLFAAQVLPGHDRFTPCAGGLSESCPCDDTEGGEPAVGRRYHLHSAAPRVRLPGRVVGRLFAAGDWLGLGPHVASRVDGVGLTHGTRSASAGAGAGASLRSGRTVCLWSLCGLAQAASHHHQHEPSRGNPYDNAQAESFIKTLKYEEVYRTEYRDLAEAHVSIREFIERVYNERRLHSALGLCPISANLVAISRCASPGSRQTAGSNKTFLASNVLKLAPMGLCPPG